ncbi:MAG TPA: SAVED domain-containing protein [Pyrinomonadaceae bacterium]|nr:SAVED domain-containing protein [Pyrinomonadaceae bacterium]
MEEFWTWLGRIADSLGTLSMIATLIFSALTFWMVRRERKMFWEKARKESPGVENFEELLRENEGVNSPKPVALAISLTPNNVSIKPNVRTFLKAQNWKMPIKEIIMNGVNTPAEQKQFVDELILRKREIQARNYTEVHLFINAPMFACILTGSILSKYWLPTKIYHFLPASQKVYEYKTPLV